MSTSSANVRIFDSTGHEVAVFEDGELVSWDHSLEIYPSTNLNFAVNGEAAVSGTALWLPADETYTIRNKEGEESYTMSIANVTDGVSLKNTVSSSAVLGVEDGKNMAVKIVEAGPNCEIEVIVQEEMNLAPTPTATPTPSATFTPRATPTPGNGGSWSWIAPTPSATPTPSGGGAMGTGFSLSFNGSTMTIFSGSLNGSSIVVNDQEVEPDSDGYARLKSGG